MMQKLSLVYIGTKPEKKDTVAGTGLVFKRLVAKLVPYDAAQTMLRFPSVWIEEEDLTDELKAACEAEMAALEAKAKQKALDDEDIDLSLLDGGNGGSDEDDDPTLAEVLEQINTKKGLDAWMVDNGIELEFEDGDTMSYRREAIINEVERLEDEGDGE